MDMQRCPGLGVCRVGGHSPSVRKQAYRNTGMSACPPKTLINALAGYLWCVYSICRRGANRCQQGRRQGLVEGLDKDAGRGSTRRGGCASGLQVTCAVALAQPERAGKVGDGGKTWCSSRHTMSAQRSSLPGTAALQASSFSVRIPEDDDCKPDDCKSECVVLCVPARQVSISPWQTAVLVYGLARLQPDLRSS